jgi:hypothetical protein
MSWLPDFSLNNIPKREKIFQNGHKIYEMAIKFTKWQKNRRNGHKIYHHLSMQGSPKFTRIWIQTIWQPCFMHVGYTLPGSAHLK